MKKLIFVIILCFVALFTPRVYWEIKADKFIDIMVIDKTVPHKDYREHLGLFWVLNNEKILKSNNELYDIGNDYYGYDPYEDKPMEAIEFTGEKDLVYVADTYGVYTSDFDEHQVGERSELIYGGIDATEWLTVLRSKGKDGTLIAEFNSLGSPTESHVAKMISDDLSIEWSEWIGRYFPDLNGEEIPAWLVENYETQYNKEWNFQYGGLVFVHTSDRVIVIEDLSEDEKLDVTFTMTSKGSGKYPEVKDSNYHYWFDIVQTKNDAEEIALFDVQLHEKGIEELQIANIPTTFPAIIHHPTNKTFYFAGDFSDYTKDKLMKWHRSDILMRIFSNEDADLFWASYVPLMRAIINDLN